MPNLIEEFNKHFEGKAIVEIEGKLLRITIDNRVLLIKLPHILAWESMG